LCKYYDSCSQISLPTLHIFGKRDEVNSFQSSYELTDYFYEPKMFIHDGGHIIPDESKKTIKDFLDAMIES
jgi:pimeloyl-ACP methyl ester carboxylesterase